MSLDVPQAPPPRPATTRRYPMTLVSLARKLYGDGDSWSPTQIKRYLAAEYGVDVALVTVRCWVVPGFADEQRRLNTESYHRRKGSSNCKPKGPAPTALDTPEKRLARMRVLRNADVSFSAIAKVFAVDTGVELSAEDVRYLLKLAANPRSAAMRKKLMGGLDPVHPA